MLYEPFIKQLFIDKLQLMSKCLRPKHHQDDYYKVHFNNLFSDLIAEISASSTTLIFKVQPLRPTSRSATVLNFLLLMMMLLLTEAGDPPQGGKPTGLRSVIPPECSLQAAGGHL